MLIDPTPWWSVTTDSPVPHLEALQAAVWSEQRLCLTYAAQARTVDPLALVLKAERWYLVAQTPDGTRVFRVDRIAQVESLPEPVVRPPDFDLPTFWQTWSAAFRQSRPRYPVQLRLSPDACARLAALRPADERAAIRSDQDITVDFQRQDIALAQLALLGGAGVEVRGPPALCAHLAALAQAWLAATPAEAPRPPDR